MTQQPQRTLPSRRVLALLLVGVVVGATVTYLVLSSTFKPSSNNATTCIIQAEGNLILKVVNDSTGTPISSVPVEVSHLAPLCPPNPHTTSYLGMAETTQNGTISVCCDVGEYYFVVTYHGTYSVNASIGPERATCVTLALPTGKVDVSSSATFQNSC